MTNPCTSLLAMLTGLPDLMFNESEQHYLLQLIANLEVRDCDTLQSALFEPNVAFDKQKLSKKNIDSIVKYLFELQKIKGALINWSLHLTLAWESITGNKISIDDMLTLIINLLPNDCALIEKIIRKLDLAYQLITTDAASYITLSIYSALTIKLQSLQKPPQAEIDFEQTTLDAISMDFALQPYIKLLQTTCSSYINYLIPLIRAQAKKDGLAYLHYFQKNKLEVDVINEMLNDLIEQNAFFDEENYICKKNETLQLLLTKYQTIAKLNAILSITNTKAHDRLEDFAKLLLSSDSLLQQNGQYAFNSFLDTSARLFGQTRRYRAYVWNATEGGYLNIFTSAIVRLQMQTPEKKQRVTCKI
jgi:hypothetical protein